MKIKGLVSRFGLGSAMVAGVLVSSSCSSSAEQTASSSTRSGTSPTTTADATAAAPAPATADSNSAGESAATHAATPNPAVPIEAPTVAQLPSAPAAEPASPAATEATASATTPPAAPATAAAAGTAAAAPAPVADPTQFHILAGTAKEAWNKADAPIVLKIGQTLTVYNDDTVAHRMHTFGTPCPHGQDIPPGGQATCTIATAIDTVAKPGLVYDHDVGPSALIYIQTSE